MAYTPRGRTHRALQHLSIGHAKFGHICRTVHGSNMTESQRTRMWRLITHMLRERLIESIADGYIITEAGEDLLHSLNGMSVRIFVRGQGPGSAEQASSVAA